MSFFERSFSPISYPTAPTHATVIRQGRPYDVDRLLEMHTRLSNASLYARYHRLWQPGRQEIEQICSLQGENGRLLVAEQEARNVARNIAGNMTRIIGMAYYVRHGDSAETALLVEDAYQGQGVGKRLIRALTETAVANGIRFFDAIVLAANKPMLRLLRHAGPVINSSLDVGACEMRVQLAA